jgi:4-amino-4-deoxychorismate lyase
VAAAVAAVAPGAAVALGAFAPAAGAAVAPGAVPPAPALATAWLVAAPAPDATAVREHGLSAVTLDRGIDSGAAARAPWLLLGAKTLSYAVNMAAIREAKRRGADEAIFVTSDGFVLEAATSSLIVRLRDELVTPAPSGGILQGTTQLSLFEYLERTGRHTATRDIPTSTLQLVDAAWLVSSTRLAVPITAIDERAIGVDAALTREFNAYLRSPRD